MPGIEVLLCTFTLLCGFCGVPTIKYRLSEINFDEDNFRQTKRLKTTSFFIF